MDGSAECMKMCTKILNGEMRTVEVKQELERIERIYGEDVFNKYDQVEKQPKPWTKETLWELRLLMVAGAHSKEFYLHMAEVADEVYAKKKKKKALKVGAGITALLVVIAIIIFVVNNQS